MPIVSRIAAMTSKAWGQFKKSGLPVLTGNYLWSWGVTPLGNYTITTLTSQSSPVQITGRSYASVTAYTSTLAISTSGSLWAWGNNTAGKLGIGTSIQTSSPVQVGTLTNWSNASTGSLATGAVKTDGTLWTWGSPTSGALGNGTTVGNVSSPVQIGTLTNWSKVEMAIGAGYGVKTDGTLWSWGIGIDGAGGRGSTVTVSSPVQVGTLTNWSTVSSKSSMAVAIKTDGTLWTWGYNNQYGLGIGTGGAGTSRSSPVQVGTLSDWTWVSNGGSTSSLTNNYGIRSNGTLWTWGGPGQDGAYGIGGVSNATGFVSYSSPVQIPANWNAAPNLMSTNSLTGVVIATNDTLWAWGKNNQGQVGNNTAATQNFVVQIGTLTWSNVTSTGETSAGVRKDGTLWTWGYNANGALGGGSTLSSVSSPVQVGTLTTWASVTPMFRTFIARKTDGTLWAWGNNSDGRLGIGSTVNQSSPVQIGTLTTWAKVFNSETESTAIKTDGTLWQWGSPGSGYFANGSTTNLSVPTQMGTLTNWASGYANSDSVLAIKTDGTLWAWGLNAYGELGIGNLLPASSPVQVGTLTNWSKVTLGNTHAVALKTDGTTWAWGRGTSGQLGQNNTTNYSSPVQVGTDTNYIDVGAAASVTWLLRNDKKLYGVGDNADVDSTSVYVGLGAQIPTYVLYPTQIGTLTTWSKVYSNAGAGGAIANKTDGTLWGWGYNSSGMFGNGTLTSSVEPVQIGTQTNLLPIASGSLYNFFLKTGGTLFGAGTSSGGVLGQTNAVNYSAPVQIGNLSDKFAAVSNGLGANTGIKPDGTLWGWGGNSSGSAGDGTTNLLSGPVQVGTLTTWTKVFTQNLVYTNFGIGGGGKLWAWGDTPSAGFGMAQNPTSYPIQFGQKLIANGAIGGLNQVGSYSSPNRFTSVVDTAGRLWAKGLNSSGQLGLGDTTNRTDILYQVGTLTSWSSVSCGSNHTLAVKTDGTLWAWGNNDLGELGNGSTTNYSSPIQIGTLTNWSTVQAGRSFSIAIKTNGTLWTWGANASYQLGNGGTVDTSSPVQVGTVTTWSSIEKHYLGGYALRSNGTLWVWGQDSNGCTAGVGSSSAPTQVGTLTNWSKLAKTSSETKGLSVVKTDGTLWAWGKNDWGQLGISSTSVNSSPVQVGTLTTWVDCGMALNNSIAIQSNGTAWGAGLNSNDGAASLGYVGAGAFDTNYNSPIQVGSWIPLGSKVISAMNGGIILNDEGYMYSWGDNTAPNATTEYIAAFSSPVQVGTSTMWASKFIKTDGTLWTWGGNGNGSGQLGLGVLNIINAPLKVGTLNNWSQAAQGSSHTMAVKTDGTMWAVGGGNNNGQLGTGTTAANRSTPIQVGTLTNWSKVACGDSVTWALKTDGTVWSWGTATTGALGNGTTTPNRSSPVQITLPTTAVDVGGSGFTGFAVLSDGTLYGWGSAANGRLGDGSTINKSNPVQIGTLTTWTKSIQGTASTYNSAISSTPST